MRKPFFTPLFRTVAAGALALLLPLGGVQADQKATKKKEKGFSLPIPIGHKAHGVKLPEHDTNGQLQMNFEIGTAHRKSETELEMEALRIETFDEEGQPELVIEMERSLLDLETRILFSTDPVRIRRTDTEITGDNMTFDTRTRQGKFTGPVRVLIFNRNELDNHQK